MKRGLVLSVVLACVLCLIGTFAVHAQFGEAPMLKALVEAGKLPPLEERLPEEPLVIEPNHAIGEYGGTINMGSASPTNWSTPSQPAVEYVLMLDKDAIETIPNIAKSWEFNEDGTTLTLHLRKGMKWSDGHPFTADDFVFWYEDVLKNEELTPVIPTWAKPKGVLMKVEKLDDYTVLYDFGGVEYWGFLSNLDGSWFRGRQSFIFLPAHALKPYHIEYNPDANKLAAENGYDHWWQDFNEKQEFSVMRMGEGIPTVGAWVLKQLTPTGVIYERNPYYFKVDTEGNQLPYVDEMRGVFYGGVFETQKMRILAGEVDFEAHGTSISDYPVFKKNEELGGYRCWVGRDAWSSIATYYVNQNYSEDPVLGDLLRNKRFRQALSLGIDREEIRDVVTVGQGTPTAATMHPDTKGFKPEWARAYADYDPEAANALLDELGLDKRSPDGWRLRPDGKELSLIMALTGEFGQFVPVSELVREYWRDLGIKAELRVMDRTYLSTFVNSSQHHVYVWMTDVMTEGCLVAGQGTYFNPAILGPWCPEWSLWLRTNGEQGEEPPSEIKDIYEWAMELPHVNPEKRVELLGKLGDVYAENVWMIGTVGMVGKPVIVNKYLGNVLETSGSDDAAWAGVRNHWVEQFYWTTPDRR